MKKIMLFLVFTIFDIAVFAQNCDCLSNFKWLKLTFEQNDAGFDYVISKKGQQAYDYLSQDLQKRALNITTYSDCRDLLAEYLRFFRKFHLSVSLSDSLAKSEAKRYAIDVSKRIANLPQATVDAHETYDISDEKWTEYLAQLPKSPTMEGIWSSPPYTIGIIKKGKGFVGFVITAPNTPFKRGHLKIKIDQSLGTYIGTTYARDFQPFYNAPVSYSRYGPNQLSVGSLSFKRIAPSFPDPPELKQYLRSFSQVTYLEKLSEQTIYLKLESFDISQKKSIDSIISNNAAQLAACKNLIIDLRGNGGGADGSYANLLPLVYTNPIRQVGVAFRSTSLNNDKMLKFSRDMRFDSKTREEAKKAYDSLQNHLGQFVMLDTGSVSVLTLNAASSNLQRVVILVDNNTGSSAEQFVIEARQSSKVKVYGKPTIGSLDISNMTETASPTRDFTLRYGTSKSLRLPNYIVDDIGLMPDVYLDNGIPYYLWVSYVKKALEGK